MAVIKRAEKATILHQIYYESHKFEDLCFFGHQSHVIDELLPSWPSLFQYTLA